MRMSDEEILRWKENLEGSILKESNEAVKEILRDRSYVLNKVLGIRR